MRKLKSGAGLQAKPDELTYFHQKAFELWNWRTLEFLDALEASAALPFDCAKCFWMWFSALQARSWLIEECRYQERQLILEHFFFFYPLSSLHLLLCLVVLKRGIRKQSALHFNHMYFLSLTSAHTESIADWCFHVSTVQQMRAEWPKRKMIIVSQEVRDIWIDDGHQCSTKRDWIQTPNRGKVLIAPM